MYAPGTRSTRIRRGGGGDSDAISGRAPRLAVRCNGGALHSSLRDAGPPGIPLRVLVADDDRVLVQLVGALLRSKGHQVIPVFDAMQAVMLAMRQPRPDAIILDINMPGGTGLESIKRLKSSLITALIPIIVLSGSNDPQMPAKVKTLGAEAFLAKPVDPAALFASLATVVPGI